MFSDPTALTINSVSTNMARINQDGYSAEYANGEYLFDISHKTTPAVTSHLVRLRQAKIAQDPVTDKSAVKSAGVHVVINVPTFGFTATEIEYLRSALLGFLTSGNLTKILAKES